MRGKDAGTRSGDQLADQREESLAARGRAEDRRELRAEDRDRRANQRQGHANQRDQVAEERDREADRREREADQREALLDQRQREADRREAELNERFRRLGLTIEALEQSTLETIERSRELLVQGAQSLGKQDAGGRMVQPRQDGRHAEVDRSAGEGERGAAKRPLEPGQVLEQSRELRARAVQAIEDFASSVETSAGFHEDLALRYPGRREEYRDAAELARAAARKAREILQTFPD